MLAVPFSEGLLPPIIHDGVKKKIYFQYFRDIVLLVTLQAVIPQCSHGVVNATLELSSQQKMYPPLILPSHDREVI